MNPIFYNLHYSNEIFWSRERQRMPVATRKCKCSLFSVVLPKNARTHTHTGTEGEIQSHRQSCPIDKRGSEPRAIQKRLQPDYREGNPITPLCSYTCFPNNTHKQTHTDTYTHSGWDRISHPGNDSETFFHTSEWVRPNSKLGEKTERKWIGKRKYERVYVVWLECFCVLLTFIWAAGNSWFRSRL